MSNAVVKVVPSAAPSTSDALVMERVIAAGDLAALSPADRVAYYAAVCRSVGLNPLTQPLEYLRLNGKLLLYAKKACTDQLRQIHRVSVVVVSREEHDGVLEVVARATMPDGRTDEDVGAVPIAGAKGESLANARMKAVTKAKRRVTLSICGLSVLDESELDTVRGAQPVRVDASTGEVVDAHIGHSHAALHEVAVDNSAVIEEQARKRNEGAAFIARADEELGAIVRGAREGDANAATDMLIAWVRMNAHAIHVELDPNSRGKAWRRLMKAHEVISEAGGCEGVTLDDIKALIVESAQEAAEE
jgi:hypothetical protein